MIQLNLQKRKFKRNDRRALLYLIAETFFDSSRKGKSITDIEATKIIKDKYGVNVERRTIGQYRLLLSDYFGISFSRCGRGHIIKSLENTANVEVHIPNRKIAYKKIVEDGNKKTLVKNIIICQRAMKNNHCISYISNHYLDETYSNFIKKSLLIAPIEIFQFRDSYFLFGYCSTIKEYFFVNLSNEKTIIKQRYNTSLSDKIIGVNKFDYETYVKKQPNNVYTGRIKWEELLHEPEYEPNEDDMNWWYIGVNEIEHCRDILIPLYEKFVHVGFDYSLDYGLQISAYYFL